MVAGLAALNDRFGRALRAWAKRRQGIDPPDIELQSRRIYILPTRSGLIFGAIVFVMLLGAMNYNNNLGFALTFLLAGVGIVSMHHCHHNLAGLRLLALGAQPVFAGEPLRFRFNLENDSGQARWQLRLSLDGKKSDTCADIDPSIQRICELPNDSPRSGLNEVPRKILAICYPLCLL